MRLYYGILWKNITLLVDLIIVHDIINMLKNVNTNINLSGSRKQSQMIRGERKFSIGHRIKS